MLQVYYFTAKWCGPCKSFGPVVDQVASENPGIISKVDVDTQKDLVQAYQITSVPRLVFIKNGQVVNSTVGAIPKSQLSQLISRHK